MADPITTMSASQPPMPQQAPAPNALAPVPLSADDLAAWRERIERSREMRKRHQVWWDANLKAYAPDDAQTPEGYGSTLNTNRDFTLVERKKADLFYQRPDVVAVPTPLMAGQEALLDTHTTILNESLGLDGINAKLLVHQVLFDVLCPSGTGFTLMGYESVTQPVPDPMSGEMIPVPVHESCFWRWFSPKQALIPHDQHTTMWDDSAWQGMEFEIPVRSAIRKQWVPKDYTGQAPSQDLHFGPTGFGGDAVARGVLIFYKSALFREDRLHPEHQTQLVLMEGIDAPAIHRDSPYQTLDPQGGLTPDSLLGFPIHPCTLRTLTDSAYVPSDCTISRPLVNELNTFRRQMVEQRDANILRWQYNTDTLPPDALSKIVRSPIGGMIGLPGEAFAGEGAIKELPHGTYPRENFAFNDYLDNDLARTHALDSNQSGANQEGETTATEAQIQQSNVNARLGLERGMVLDWYCKGVTKFSTLLARYLPVQKAAAIVGMEQATAWDQWRKMVPATLAFTAMPDSTLRNDLAGDRKRAMDQYTYFANDPFIDRGGLLKETLPKLGLPARLVIQPPPKGPEPAKPGFSFKGEDLNPLAPQFAIVMEILKQAGVTVSPQAIAQAQAGAQNALMAQQVVAQQAPPEGEGPDATTHGGKVPQMESLSKHANALTGNMQGSGAPAPMGAGGTLQ